MLTGGFGGQAELLDPVPDLVAIDTQELPGLCLIAVGTFQGLDQQLPLDFVETHPFGRQLELG